MIKEITFKQMLLDSTKEVFETMIFMDVAEAEDPKQVEGWSLMGLISFKGDLEGSLSLSCSTECAQNIAMNMLGFDSVDELTEADTCDAIGEVVNMIVGRVKNFFADCIGNIEISIPSVINGRELKNNLGEDAKVVTTDINIQDQFFATLSLLYKKTN